MEMNLEQELKQQIKNGTAWDEQIKNVLSASLWFLMIWSVSVVTLMGLMFLFFLSYNQDLSFVSFGGYPEFREGILKLSGVLAGLSAVFIAFFGLPRKLRNVFKSIAKRRVERHYEELEEQALRNEAMRCTEQQVNAMLLRYGLITDRVINQKYKH